ncbi:hypothetical protein ACHAW5_000901 [Stephanodiscus triporus]|uniref:Uncharacterized protein n=1 Tax=Stephanodiscus triporus TaxID=2934178 RepID=A0ABD3P4R7_9STRA
MLRRPQRPGRRAGGGGGRGLVGKLFGNNDDDRISQTASSSSSSSSKKKTNVADTDPTGRTVTFADGSSGTIVAHRDPLSFVLVAEPLSRSVSSCSLYSSSSSVGDDGTSCAVSAGRTSIDPSTVAPGSIVDYLGRPLVADNDGYVTVDPDFEVVVDDDVEEKEGEGGGRRRLRPIFMPTPKISDIGLIDSPLVTGITAIDALTPIGKGQNMLVIGVEEDEDEGRDIGRGGGRTVSG